jgi:hypothetical protein
VIGGLEDIFKARVLLGLQQRERRNGLMVAGL